MRLLLSFSLLLLGSLASARAPAEVDASTWIEPEMAVILAADAGPSGVTGVFVLRVEATGAQDDKVYLNSRPDYRDTLNLTVALSLRAARQLGERLGEEAQSALKGRVILVRGTARRTRIDFRVDGRATGKYYYQTHVNVVDGDQILVDPLPEEPSEGVST